MKKPLKLFLDRRWKKADYTIGVLYINGTRFCEVLEDAVRDHKIAGCTAIPAGTYKIDMNTVSPKFKNKQWAKLFGGIVPRLVDVPNYSGVLVHPGNTAADTEGCLLPGKNREKGKVLDSQVTYRLLMENYLMPAKYAGQEIIIEIAN